MVTEYYIIAYRTHPYGLLAVQLYLHKESFREALKFFINRGFIIELQDKVTVNDLKGLRKNTIYDQ